MTNLRLLKQFIGIDIEKYDARIKVIQKSMFHTFLLNFKISECKASNFPFLLGIKLGDFAASPLVNNLLYKQLVGSLLYITYSLPDLEYAIGVVDRYMHEHHEIHWKD